MLCAQQHRWVVMRHAGFLKIWNLWNVWMPLRGIAKCLVSIHLIQPTQTVRDICDADGLALSVRQKLRHKKFLKLNFMSYIYILAILHTYFN